MSERPPGADVSGADRAAEELRNLIHANRAVDDLTAADLYRLAGDLARTAHHTADAIGLIAGALVRLDEQRRLRHDDKGRRAAVADTLAHLERARRTLGTAGFGLDAAHNDLGHLDEADPLLHTVADDSGDAQ